MHLSPPINRRVCGSSLILALAVLVLSRSDYARAQANHMQVKEQAAASATTSRSRLPAIEIKIQMTGNQFKPDAPIGVMADISNVSDARVFLRRADTVLILPPEVERSGGGILTTSSAFPTEWETPADQQILSLRPNESYRVFWNYVTENAPEQRRGGSQSFFQWLRTLFGWTRFIPFTPGEYPITVEAKYWDQKKFEEYDYHTAFQSKTVQFAAPQPVILFGAALGGLIFWALSIVRAEQSEANGATVGLLKTAKTYGKTIAAILGSILLSWIVTILLSRVSEAQFFIKVTVSDVWGAVALGFIANYGGWALLDKMISPSTKKAAAAPSQVLNAPAQPSPPAPPPTTKQ
jgi:hypothetical protein